MDGREKYAALRYLVHVRNRSTTFLLFPYFFVHFISFVTCYVRRGRLESELMREEGKLEKVGSFLSERVQKVIALEEDS